MDPVSCPLGTPWCTDHEPPDAPDNWAECVSIIGTVVLDHGPTTAAFRSDPDPDDGTSGEVIISVRQIEGDSPIVEVEWPDSTAEFPGVENCTPREVAGTWSRPRVCWTAACRPVDETPPVTNHRPAAGAAVAADTHQLASTGSNKPYYRYISAAIRCHRPVHEAFNSARAPDSVVAQLDAASSPNVSSDGHIDARCGGRT